MTLNNQSNDSELLEKLKNKVAVEVLEALAQAKYGISYFLLDKHQQQHLVVDAGNSCKNLLALLQAEILKARIDELRNFNPFFNGDHSKCLLQSNCIGYQIAQSDFENERELRIVRLKEGKETKLPL